ncbi:MAG: class I SAM-dependent DNA methyltransferase [Phenylobacterium sp.]|uniref:class I SAM-dependent DNA methyltransferase n=1 Tax=Phenylobacterium sp. TaxID=1871053 RepID=UPI0025ECC625|nr:DNA methyltransferase [Phenylobacterium sp.]MCA3739018.1 class I SAM-dependent DNA methyltransferase [Phenylobacterium sp.]
MAVEAFIERWSASEGAERANYALFLSELCDLLEVERPHPARADSTLNDYVFERAVRFNDPVTGSTTGRIDLYKRGCFVLEAKQSRERGQPKAVEQDGEAGGDGPASTRRSWDVLMLNARRQAEDYARALPDDHDWPPFLVTCDVGNCFEIYADFSGRGRNYSQFPDRTRFRVYLADLRSEDTRALLRAIWTDPHSLDPAKRTEKVTREVAKSLAEVSKSLEKDGHDPEAVAMFLMRCLFTMFAEDAGLLPEHSFENLLRRCEADPALFTRLVGQLWQAMDTGQFAFAFETTVRRFNGKLFRDATVFGLDAEGIGHLRSAASKRWTDVDPSIFGALLERALSTKDRAKLGAHFTPRAYVERLVVITVIEPLRQEWNAAQAAMDEARSRGNVDEARQIAADFHHRLATVRVLDPACGTGNFLYVTLELMKRLEGEVLDALAGLGEDTARLGFQGETVDPHQFLGLELNPRAAAISELVLWIGYLQWNLRTLGGAAPSDPVLQAYGNIEVADALLTYELLPPVRLPNGQLKTRWDGETKAVHPVTGKKVPDLTAQVLVHRYVNPRPRRWPQADFIVGNPPFIGIRVMRDRLGDEYRDALLAAYPDVPGTADLVMYWWMKAARAVRERRTKRFGLVTTNSITQQYSRVAVEKALSGRQAPKLIFAVADHPWVEDKDGANVRISMTVCAAPDYSGPLRLGTLTKKKDANTLRLAEVDRIFSDLTASNARSRVKALESNKAMCFQGCVPGSDGFKLKADELSAFGNALRDGRIRPYIIGDDLTERLTHEHIIDVEDLDEDQLRRTYPAIYQRLLLTVKPARDLNRNAHRRKYWWRYAAPAKTMRDGFKGLSRYIATPYTAKHRPFVFVASNVIPDAMAYAITSDSAALLAVLSSAVHHAWCRYFGGTLEDRPRFNNTEIFPQFPFPELSAAQSAVLADLGETLDRLRKDQIAAHENLTITGLYNVVERLRAIRADTSEPPLTDAERAIHDAGLASRILELHDQIDAAVISAYGWPPEVSAEDMFKLLVELNAARAAEEAAGQIKWLRPDYQTVRATTPIEEEGDLGLEEREEEQERTAFPTNGIERAGAIMAVLAGSEGPLTVEQIAAHFTQGLRARAPITSILNSLARTGAIGMSDGHYYLRKAA